MSGQDSMLKFLIFLFACSMQVLHVYSQEVTVVAKKVTCNQGADGSITVDIKFGTPGYTIKLYDKTPAVKQKILRELQTKDNQVIFKNLPAKKYYLLITDSKYQRIVKEVLVEEPGPLTYTGFTVLKHPSSEGSNDGSIELNVSGGSTPYIFNWDDAATNQQTQIANSLSYGIYDCNITDKNNCESLRASVLFLEKPKNNKEK